MTNTHRKISSVLLALAFSLSGCSLFQKVETPVVATVKDCANEVTHSATLNILDNVSAVLICDGGNATALPPCVVAQLTVIAAKSGWVAIDCAIAEIQQKAAANVNASGDPTETIRWRRADAVTGARKAGTLGPSS